MTASRRRFLQQSAAATAALLVPGQSGAAENDSGAARDVHELRCYRLKAESRLKADADAALLDAYLENAVLPALAKLGMPGVGVFTEADVNKETVTATPKAGSPVWVLITHRSLESFLHVSAELLRDPQVSRAAAAYLQAPKGKPPFERIDTWLYRAFRGLPQLHIPAFSRTRVPTRIFEMRDYESYSEERALNKMDMFDDGEIALMQDLGMNPVFFGQGVAGPDLPHLRYITCAPDLATHLGNWKRFGPDPRWIAMRDDPRYQDNVSRNTARFLLPRPYSAL